MRALNLKLPPVIFGTSGLGNLFVALPDETKLAIVAECLAWGPAPVVFDSAGKYGAGLALETLGRSLGQLGVPPEKVLISNKLGWLRTELQTPEPTFEPGVWRNLRHDAVQRISYEGILACYEQGNELLGAYAPQLVSVHDPDEYLAAAQTPAEAEKRYADVLDAYRALLELKAQGRVQAVGVGAKSWPVIQRISRDVSLDWVMIANSMTLMNHPPELVAFMEDLHRQGVQIINSAVFQAGFLIGGDYYDYKAVDREQPAHQPLFAWRDCFFELCRDYGVAPAAACVRFGLQAPGVVSIALNTTNPKRVKENVALATAPIPEAFWEALRKAKLIRPDYRYLQPQNQPDF